MNAFKTLFTVAFLGLVVACSGGSDNTGNTSSSSSSGSSKRASSSSSSGSDTPSEDTDPTETTSSSSGGSSSGGSSKPSGATSVACTSADDCGYWFCDCKDSSGRISPVNGRNCNNGWCMDAATSCPDACSAFGKTWTGTAGGGPDQK